MKKFFLFAAAIIVAVSMNVRAAETPDNVKVRTLLLEMMKLQNSPMPATYAQELDATLEKIEQAETLDTPNWTELYKELKATYDKCQEGIEFYETVDAAIAKGKNELITASPNARGREELTAAIVEAAKGYEARTLLPDNPKDIELVATLVTPLELDKTSLFRKLVGTEIREMKPTTSDLAANLEPAQGTGVTYNYAIASDCYVNGVKMTSVPGYYKPTKKQTLQDAIDNNIWFGAKMTIAKDAGFMLDSIIVHLGSATNNYTWDVYLYDSNGETLYFTEAAYKIANYNNANHTGDYVVISDSAAFAELGALPAGDYEIRIYLYGNKNNNIFLKELSVKGLAINGNPYIAPEVNMPDSMVQLLSVARTNLSYNMYYQHKANLEEAIENCETDTFYQTNYEYLSKTNIAAVASALDYGTLNEELIIAKGILDAAETTQAGYDTYKAAVETAQKVYDNGTAETVASTLKTLIVAEKAFYAAAASEENPVDVTTFISNADFTQDIDSATNWYIAYDPSKIDYSVCEPDEDKGYTGNFIEAVSEKKFQGYTISQTLVNIPNGDYKFTAKVLGLEGTNNNKGTLKLYANDKSATCSRAAQAKETSVYVRVTDNTLKLVFTETDNRNNSVDFGDVKLEYYNFRSWASIKLNADSTAYDVTINSQESFDDAFLKTDWAEGKDVNFILSNPNDIEYYNLTTNEKAFPANHGNFTIKAASGATPKIAGSMKPSQLVVNNFTVEGLTFIANKATGTYQNSEASPIYINKNKKDTISGELLFTNCTFINLPGAIARIKGDGNGNYVHSLTVEYCYVDSMYQNLFQFGGGNGYGMSNFTFRENKVCYKYQKDQGQVFNIAISAKHPANDSVFTMNIENNAFYKMSGNHSGDKLFLEFNKTSDWKEVYVNINNNIFYDRYDWTGGMHCGLSLCDLTEGQNGEVNVLNNVFYPENVMKGGYEDIFHVTSGNIPCNRENHLFADSTWQYTPDMKMVQTHKYFTAGVKGTYVGPRSNYYDFQMEGADYVVNSVASFTQALEYFNTVDNNKNLTVYFKDCADECGYYALAMTGRNFPQKFGDITFKPYEGANPQISGSFRSGNGMKVNTYTVENLSFVEGNMNGKTDASPIYIHKGVKDSVMNEIIIRNCSFKDMPACMIRINANNNENYIHSILVENNTVDGIAHHFFQFAAKNIGLQDFTFRENIVKNMYATGGQFFNTPVSSNAVAGTDSIYTMTVDHNTFYKIGGKATADRNFLECANNNTWKEVYINFTNNIFYDRYDWTGRAESDLKLFVTDTVNGQKAEVNFLKNVLAPLNVMANADVEKYGNISFPVIQGNITPTYDHIAADTVKTFWMNEDNLIRGWNTDTLYTAGVKGTYVGAKASYLAAPGVPANAKYYWESPEGVAYEIGGKVAQYDPSKQALGRLNYPNAGYYSICLNANKDWTIGKNDAKADYWVYVNLDEPIASGDSIMIAAYRNKGDVSKTSGALLQFNETDFNDGTDGTFYNDIAVSPEAGYSVQKLALPATAVGATSFKMTRSYTSTNLFIVKLAILKGNGQNAPAIDGIEEVSNINGIFANNGVLYINLNEASMVKVYDMTGRALKSVNAVEGLNAIEGLSEGQIYIVRTDNEIVKIAL